jgi:hypothetical protein
MARFAWRQPRDDSSSAGSRSSTQFQDTVVPATLALAPALLQDMARTFREFGVQSFRASVVDIDSMAFQATWTITDNGEVTEGGAGRPLDSLFPGAASTIAMLAQTPDDETLVQKLSPRRWGFAWYLEDPNVIIAEAHFRDRRDEVTELDTALVRLVCGAALRAGAMASPADATGQLRQAQEWPQTERRSGAQAPGSAPGLSVGLIAASAVLAGVLGLVALPQMRSGAAEQQVQLERLHAMVDKTMVRNLSTAMATGDYGEVQAGLSSFASLGYFEGAVVTNARQRIVALAGPPERLRIGDPVPADVQRRAQALELAMGSERLGQLLVVPVPPRGVAAGQQSGLWQGMALAALGASLAALLLLTLRRKPPHH